VAEESHRSLAAGMIERYLTAILVLLICLGLGSCASFSNYVSDHWPTWAGGMPTDVPPRPGAPGYDEFLLRQQGKEPTGSAAPVTAAGSGPGVAAAPPAPAATAPLERTSTPAAAPLPNAARNDQAAVQGGLY